MAENRYQRIIGLQRELYMAAEVYALARGVSPMGTEIRAAQELVHVRTEALAKALQEDFITFDKNEVAERASVRGYFVNPMTIDPLDEAQLSRLDDPIVLAVVLRHAIVVRKVPMSMIESPSLRLCVDMAATVFAEAALAEAEHAA